MLVGYKLIRDSDQAEVQTWGGAWGSYPSIPNPLFLPNGDHVHAPSIGVSYSGFTLYEWHMEQPPPTAADVRNEASRRMQVAFGARDADHLAIIVANATREVARLNQIKVGVPHPAGGWLAEPREWDAPERLRLAQLHTADAMLEAIRAASNVLEAADPVPADYAADRRWPG